VAGLVSFPYQKQKTYQYKILKVGPIAPPRLVGGISLLLISALLCERNTSFTVNNIKNVNKTNGIAFPNSAMIPQKVKQNIFQTVAKLSWATRLIYNWR
jgi:hypothetical protein